MRQSLSNQATTVRYPIPLHAQFLPQVPKIEPNSSQRKFAVLQERPCIARVDFDLPFGFRRAIWCAGHSALGFDLPFAKKPQSNGPRH